MSFRHDLPISIKISPTFWLMSCFIGYSLLAHNWQMSKIPLLLILTVIFVFSILAHELGHALFFYKMGIKTDVYLHAFGGRTSPRLTSPLTPGEEILTSLAGPLAGLVLGGILWLADYLYPHAILHYATWINLLWSFINLAPLLPLDGGHAIKALLTILCGRKSEKYYLIFSVIVLALASGAALWLAWYWTAVIVIYLLLINIYQIVLTIRYAKMVVFQTLLGEIRQLRADGKLGEALHQAELLQKQAATAEEKDLAAEILAALHEDIGGSV